MMDELKPRVYRALVPLLMPQGEGQVPSVIRFAPGQKFELDGTEPIDVAMLLRLGQIRVDDSETFGGQQ